MGDITGNALLHNAYLKLFTYSNLPGKNTIFALTARSCFPVDVAG